MKAQVAVLLIVVAFSYALESPVRVIEKSGGGQAAYPEWAHHHWVWLSRANNTQSQQIAFYQSWIAHDIPVGAMDIDSMWSSGINNFLWDSTAFPDPKGMMQYFKSQGVRIILWITSVVDTDSSNYQEGYLNNYFMNNGSTFKWWHGEGSLLDYTNPMAVQWWHAQMDNVLDIGIDGWKCDGTDPFVLEFIYPRGYGGAVSAHQYGHMYYRDFLFYSRTKNPDALIMSRPVDSVGPIYWDFSPKNVMMAGWVGDQQGNWAGFQHAMNNMIYSALQGYANFGSDIGGYKKTSHRELIVFVRWFQQGCFVPLMENGGNQEHRPWKWDTPGSTLILDTYRKYVHTHLELLPYLLNAGTIALENGISVLKPIASQVILSHSWDYWLWKDIFVAPVVEAPGTSRVVQFPVGDDFMDYFNSSKVYSGGSVVNISLSISDFPVFQRVGSLIPLEVNSALTNHGLAIKSKFAFDEEHPFLTAMVAIGPTQTAVHTMVKRWKEAPMEMWHEYSSDGQRFKLTATAHSKGVIILLRGVKGCPTSVVDEIYGRAMEPVSELGLLYATKRGAFYCERATRQVYILSGQMSPYGTQVVVEGVRRDE